MYGDRAPAPPQKPALIKCETCGYLVTRGSVRNGIHYNMVASANGEPMERVCGPVERSGEHE